MDDVVVTYADHLVAYDAEVVLLAVMVHSYVVDQVADHEDRVVLVPFHGVHVPSTVHVGPVEEHDHFEGHVVLVMVRSEVPIVAVNEVQVIVHVAVVMIHGVLV